MPGTDFEDVWRHAAPYVLAALLRRYDNFADCEDAVQLALVAAAEQWPGDGIPDEPIGWLTRVASRRMIDQIRADVARRTREEKVARLDAATPETVVDAEDDDTLQLLMLCTHAALSPTSQVALMLRAVGGLTTREIAEGFFVPEATMAQRISRAKSTLRRAGARFERPAPAELPRRLLAVRHAIALLYTRSHAAEDGADQRPSALGTTAIRLARELHRLAPTDPENAGLLALLLLTEARRPARFTGDGDLVPLDEQDRTSWDHALITEGVDLVERTLPVGYVGSFQLQAAIAAVHDEADTAGATDWPQIRELYDMLWQVDPSPAVALGRAIAVAEVDGPEAGLAALDRAPDTSHRVDAARGHLLRQAGRYDEARAAFLRAAERSRSIPEQRYLNRLAATSD
ncbi:RNA polymerase sigma factor [Flexivirga sp. B27]